MIDLGEAMSGRGEALVFRWHSAIIKRFQHVLCGYYVHVQMSFSLSLSPPDLMVVYR